MKCKNCGGELLYDNGILTCQNCGSVFSAKELIDDIDVYICYIESDNNGRRTKDSVMAQEIYYMLEEKKIKAFYKKLSLESYSGDMASGVDKIALEKASVILIVGTNKENYENIWEEYSTAISGKKVIPIYAVMNAYDIPKQINALQALKYDNVGSSVVLIKTVQRLLGRATEEEQDYETVHIKSNAKQKMLFAVIAIFGILVIGGVVVHGILKNKDAEVPSGEVDNEVIYKEAITFIEKEQYADAIEVLTTILDYKDSSGLLHTCYAKYSGYYYDTENDLSFQIQYYDNNGSVKIYSHNQNGEICTIDETIIFTGRECNFTYTDSENNHGMCRILMNNNGIVLSINNEEVIGNAYIPDMEKNFLLSEKNDQPMKKDISIDFLKKILAEETTIGDLKRLGYNMVFAGTVGFEMGSDSKYQFENTDIYVIAYQKPDEGEEYVDNDTSNDDDNLFVFVVEAPMDIVDSSKIGELDIPYIDSDYVFYPNGFYADGVGGFVCNSYDINSEITGDTVVSFKLMNDYDMELYVDDVTEKKNENTGIFDMSKILKASASSSLVWNDMEYPPENIYDGLLDTAWQEGVDGFGEGESITLYFDGKYILNGIAIYAGYQKNEKLYTENGRPKDIRISFDNGNYYSYMLEDICDKQFIIFEFPVETGYVTITITSVYKGTKYEDTSISEIEFLGENDYGPEEFTYTEEEAYKSSDTGKYMASMSPEIDEWGDESESFVDMIVMDADSLRVAGRFFNDKQIDMPAEEMEREWGISGSLQYYSVNPYTSDSVPITSEYFWFLCGDLESGNGLEISVKNGVVEKLGIVMYDLYE